MPARAHTHTQTPIPQPPTLPPSDQTIHSTKNKPSSAMTKQSTQVLPSLYDCPANLASPEYTPSYNTARDNKREVLPLASTTNMSTRCSSTHTHRAHCTLSVADQQESIQMLHQVVQESRAIECNEHFIILQSAIYWNSFEGSRTSAHDAFIQWCVYLLSWASYKIRQRPCLSDISAPSFPVIYMWHPSLFTTSRPSHHQITYTSTSQNCTTT